MTRARVLLVEDDPSIRRFVALALEDLDLELLEAASLAEARLLLATGALRLLISDLMLPDGSGITLLQELAADPARRAGARLVAFSAGITAEKRAQLLALGVDEVLSKPVSLLALEDCVQRALAGTAPASEAAPVPPSVVEQYFGGNQALYAAYRASCLAQFVLDRQQGDQAAAAGEMAALRRLAHSLKSVLLTLGHGEASRQAAALELTAEGADLEAAQAGWARLRNALVALPPLLKAALEQPAAP